MGLHADAIEMAALCDKDVQECKRALKKLGNDAKGKTAKEKVMLCFSEQPQLSAEERAAEAAAKAKADEEARAAEETRLKEAAAADEAAAEADAKAEAAAQGAASGALAKTEAVLATTEAALKAHAEEEARATEEPNKTDEDDKATNEPDSSEVVTADAEKAEEVLETNDADEVTTDVADEASDG